MKSIIFKGLGILAVMGMLSCATRATRPDMVYYSGMTPQDEYFEVVDYTLQEIEFKIRVNFPSRYMYHLILEDNEPLAEGWFPTIISTEDFYRLVIRAKDGVVFEPGKTYRLCIGNKNPEEIARYRNSYQCAVDYKFVLAPK
ncbi:MAG: hypothetical protein WBC70_15260 [Candidatus Aminicenantales bacterium]